MKKTSTGTKSNVPAKPSEAGKRPSRHRTTRLTAPRYSQGAIVLIPFPYDDLTGVKQRPALILSNDVAGAHHICCMVTSKPQTEGILLGPNAFSEGSLPKRSWVRPQKLFTVNESIIRKKLCTVNKSVHVAAQEQITTCLTWRQR